MAEHYLALKWLHVVGAAVLFGTGLAIAFNFWLALRGASVAMIAAAARATVIADFAFTMPAVALLRQLSVIRPLLLRMPNIELGAV